jgi:glycosyltransferase involved in cell wall biosynthesis
MRATIDRPPLVPVSVRGRDACLAPAPSVLLVASFVLPHAGGVEQFVESSRRILEDAGSPVRVLACRIDGEQPRADATVPVWLVPPAGWPLPTGGLRTLWREVGRSDVVVANGARQLLPVMAALAARVRRRRLVFVLHGANPPVSQSLLYRALGTLFVHTIARLAVRAGRAASVSRAGVEAARRLYAIEAVYVPYPVPPLAPAAEQGLDTGEALRVVWVGRLHPEKAPLLAVETVERARLRRDATLDVYGDGLLRRELLDLARSRPWVTVHGAKPWHEIQQRQAAAHVCLSTSVRDNVQVAVLEALSRGIPVVATRVGEAPEYYPPSLDRFCVPARDVNALARALLELADSYEASRRQFAENGDRLRALHRRGAEALVDLVADGAAAAA